jgi:hypothetical protein
MELRRLLNEKNLVFLWQFLLLLLFGACGATEAGPGKTVSEFLDAMKSYDLEALAEYYSDATDSDYTLDDFSYAKTKPAMRK